MKKTLLIVVITSLLVSGCATVGENRNYCITAGAIAGALAAGVAEDDNESEAALGGAVVGGAIAWLVCRTDTDGDGVVDDKDSCPGTPSGASVDKRGCALDSDRDGVSDHEDACPNTDAGAPVDSRGCDQDSDGEGVRDDHDACPNTTRGTNVDNRGCALDGDDDGVADSKDSCPDTAAGKSVDRKGCHVMFSLNGVNFEYDSNELTDSAKNQLGAAIQSLQQQPKVSIQIGGHTDSIGSEKYNLNLSEQRANAVRDHLISEGVSARRLTARGYGESRPVATNDTESGRGQNRRVEFVVTSNW